MGGLCPEEASVPVKCGLSLQEHRFHNAAAAQCRDLQFQTKALCHIY